MSQVTGEVDLHGYIPNPKANISLGLRFTLRQVFESMFSDFRQSTSNLRYIRCKEKVKQTFVLCEEIQQ